jgi:peptidoglycan hydrolase-like protein with peptidoglycan-binding domain
VRQPSTTPAPAAAAPATPAPPDAAAPDRSARAPGSPVRQPSTEPAQQVATTPAAPAAAAPNQPTGDAQLKEIQQLLTMMNYDPGPADGKAGRKTRDAIAAFQRSQKLPVDRRPSAALLESLRKATGADTPDWTPGHF